MKYISPKENVLRILGHKNRRTTEVYLHSIGEAEREAMSIYEMECQLNPHTNPHIEKEKGFWGIRTPDLLTVSSDS